MTEQPELNAEVLVRALMEFSGRSRAQVEELMAGKSVPGLLSFRDSPKVRPIYERLMSEMAAEE